MKHKILVFSGFLLVLLMILYTYSNNVQNLNLTSNEIKSTEADFIIKNNSELKDPHIYCNVMDKKEICGIECGNGDFKKSKAYTCNGGDLQTYICDDDGRPIKSDLKHFEDFMCIEAEMTDSSGISKYAGVMIPKSISCVEVNKEGYKLIYSIIPGEKLEYYVHTESCLGKDKMEKLSCVDYKVSKEYFDLDISGKTCDSKTIKLEPIFNNIPVRTKLDVSVAVIS